MNLDAEREISQALELRVGKTQTGGLFFGIYKKYTYEFMNAEYIYIYYINYIYIIYNYIYIILYICIFGDQ